MTIMISRAQLEARLQALKTQRDQTLANANALAGAIQVVEDLLQEWGAPESVPPVPDAPPTP